MIFLLSYCLAASSVIGLALFIQVWELRRRARIAGRFISFVRESPVGSGVCCCGESMDKHSHPMACGHSPRDEWDYALTQWVEELKKEGVI